MAYVGTNTGLFGTIDLNTGTFTSAGNSGQVLAGMAVANGSLFASAYHTGTGTLFNINVANGSLTTIGSSGINIDDFGSTTSGLYAVGSNTDLYSINATTGAATLIGPTGLSFGSWRSLSTNSGTLFFANGTNLYTLNTSTGAATLLGALGGSSEIGAMVFEGGVLYGGDTIHDTIDTIDIGTGSATVGPSPSAGFAGSFFGLAPSPIPSPVATPEPASMLLCLGGLSALAVLWRRSSRKARLSFGS